MKLTIFFLVSLFALTLAVEKPAKCPCKCFTKNSFAVRRQMAKKQCRFPQFFDQCTTFKCSEGGRVGFECCEKFDLEKRSPSPSPSPAPVECPCICRQGDRAFRFGKRECKKYDGCKVSKCGKNKKWHCCN